MRFLAVATAVIVVGFTLPAWAGQETGQNTSNPQMRTQMEQHTGAASTANHAQVERQLRAELTKAGFTDIHVMPQSFLVRAKNAEGMPVMMVINPDSVTAVTAIRAPRHQGSMEQGSTGGMSGSPASIGKGGNTGNHMPGGQKTMPGGQQTQ